MVKNISINKGYILILLLLVMVLSVNFASALLTAKVGNGKFVITNATVGDVISRTMKIYNNNSFDVKIELVPSGNLSSNIKIIDNNITMKPNTEKDFRFSVTITQEGRNDGEIIVKFIPADVINGKNGIALPTTMTIFAVKGNGNTDTGGNKDTSGNDSGTDSNNEFGLIGSLLAGTAVVFVVLLILLFIYTKRKNNPAKNIGVKNRDAKEEKLNTKKRIKL